MKTRDLVTGCVLILFLILCFHFYWKGQQGPWHDTVTSLWNNEEWGKLQALAENLFRVGKTDAEASYFGMLASAQTKNTEKTKLFAERLSSSGVLNWKMELQTGKIYQPDTLYKRILLFRTRMIYLLLALLTATLIASMMKGTLYYTAPAAISILGIAVLLM